MLEVVSTMEFGTEVVTLVSTTCKGCAGAIAPLAEFPGTLCTECWAASAEGQRIVSAEELVAMWGGPVRKGR